MYASLSLDEDSDLEQISNERKKHTTDQRYTVYCTIIHHIYTFFATDYCLCRFYTILAVAAPVVSYQGSVIRLLYTAVYGYKTSYFSNCDNVQIDF